MLTLNGATFGHVIKDHTVLRDLVRDLGERSSE